MIYNISKGKGEEVMKNCYVEIDQCVIQHLHTRDVYEHIRRRYTIKCNFHFFPFAKYCILLLFFAVMLQE